MCNTIYGIKEKQKTKNGERVPKNGSIGKSCRARKKWNAKKKVQRR
jgi:hypothetical protein